MGELDREVTGTGTGTGTSVSGTAIASPIGTMISSSSFSLPSSSWSSSSCWSPLYSPSFSSLSLSEQQALVASQFSGAVHIWYSWHIARGEKSSDPHSNNDNTSQQHQQEQQQHQHQPQPPHQHRARPKSATWSRSPVDGTSPSPSLPSSRSRPHSASLHRRPFTAASNQSLSDLNSTLGSSDLTTATRAGAGAGAIDRDSATMLLRMLSRTQIVRPTSNYRQRKYQQMIKQQAPCGHTECIHQAQIHLHMHNHTHAGDDHEHEHEYKYKDMNAGESKGHASGSSSGQHTPDTDAYEPVSPRPTRRVRSAPATRARPHAHARGITSPRSPSAATAASAASNSLASNTSSSTTYNSMSSPSPSTSTRLVTSASTGTVTATAPTVPVPRTAAQASRRRRELFRRQAHAQRERSHSHSHSRTRLGNGTDGSGSGSANDGTTATTTTTTTTTTPSSIVCESSTERLARLSEPRLTQHMEVAHCPPDATFRPAISETAAAAKTIPSFYKRLNAAVSRYHEIKLVGVVPTDVEKLAEQHKQKQQQQKQHTIPCKHHSHHSHHHHPHPPSPPPPHQPIDSASRPPPPPPPPVRPSSTVDSRFSDGVEHHCCSNEMFLEYTFQPKTKIPKQFQQKLSLRGSFTERLSEDLMQRQARAQARLQSDTNPYHPTIKHYKTKRPCLDFLARVREDQAAREEKLEKGKQEELARTACTFTPQITTAKNSDLPSFITRMERDLQQRQDQTIARAVRYGLPLPGSSSSGGGAAAAATAADDDDTNF